LRVGMRSLPADGLTASGYIDTAERVYVTVSHSGITLAPLLGKLAAQELQGEECPLLAAFRPGRFAEGHRQPIPSPARAPGDQ
jgi:D-hydroxyproline dehydrogenase subunit beta